VNISATARKSPGEHLRHRAQIPTGRTALPKPLDEQGIDKQEMSGHKTAEVPEEKYSQEYAGPAADNENLAEIEESYDGAFRPVQHHQGTQVPLPEQRAQQRDEIGHNQGEGGG
jgi:hypothetical protein